jgi:hypothetical protein
MKYFTSLKNVKKSLSFMSLLIYINILDFFMVKIPAADATDAPQPRGLLCYPVMNMISFLFFLVMKHRWNEIERGKPKYSGKNISQCHFVHHKSHMD